MISAGSGITPIMSKLREACGSGARTDVVMIHSARSRDQVIFGDELDRLHADRPWLSVHLQETGAVGRMSPTDLDRLCPDWTERITLASGPGPMLDELSAHWEAHGIGDRLLMERFQPVIKGAPGVGEGGEINFSASGIRAECEPGKPILQAGEEAGAGLPFGCRMGICHTCVGRLCAGRVRDLRTGEIHGSEGETIRTCVNAPEGPIEIKL